MIAAIATTTALAKPPKDELVATEVFVSFDALGDTRLIRGEYLAPVPGRVDVTFGNFGALNALSWGDDEILAECTPDGDLGIPICVDGDFRSTVNNGPGGPHGDEY